MPSKPAPLVFFGSGPVAARTLGFLRRHFQIELVITKKPAGRRVLAGSVQAAARQPGLSILELAAVQTGGELSRAILGAPLKSRVGVVVDFGLLIPGPVIKAFPLGIINSHFSLLPEWRGADPISCTILSGQRQTGVSLMLINERLDEGPLLAQKVLPASPRELDGRRLTNELIKLSNGLLRSVLPLYLAGKLTAYPQSDQITPSYSRKLRKEDGRMDWNKSAERLEREIRAFIEWPKSRGLIGGLEVIISRARVTADSGPAGDCKIINRDGLLVYCGRGALLIERLKPPGKPEMSAAAFLAGYGGRLTGEPKRPAAGRPAGRPPESGAPGL